MLLKKPTWIPIGPIVFPVGNVYARPTHRSFVHFPTANFLI